MGISTRPNKESAVFRPQEYFKNGNVCISGVAKYIKARDNHVFVNYALYDVELLKYLRKGHKVHIFTCEICDQFYGVDNFFEFCEKAYKISGRSVTIHIPKNRVIGDNKKLKYVIRARLDGFYGYRIRAENGVQTLNL